ncbi:MAG TPA: YidC/Oxa1 family membrane protein insertase [Gaiellaceae bacterium]|nr:YidC/Oxa1 family membrane protein insertase [Gaiellaceae bacterium]
MIGAALLVFSILQPLENAVRWVLDQFHYHLGVSWAWAIVGTTICVRILLVPLTVKQIHSMQALQKHAPEMKEIQRKYKGDRAKQNEAMMAFYKENKINPAASCLPLLAQAPVFISLYLVLKNFSKHVPEGSDLSWLHFVPDITAKADSHWSGFVLLFVYAASQISSTYFMSQAMDKTQRRIMMLLPLVFITVIAHFKVGLLIYWVTTNLWTVGQGLVTRRLVPKTPPTTPPPAGPKRSSRTPSPAPENGGSGNGTKIETPKPAPPKGPTQPRRVKRNKGTGRK